MRTKHLIIPPHNSFNHPAVTAWNLHCPLLLSLSLSVDPVGVALTHGVARKPPISGRRWPMSQPHGLRRPRATPSKI